MARGYTLGPKRVKRGVSHVPETQRPSAALQDVVSGAFGFEQTPVLVLHVPATWQTPGAAHVTELPPVHVPL
jgi:hypothetical protein